MEEAIKNRIILILAIVTIIFFVISIGSCSKARQMRLIREDEMAKRLDVEAEFAKFSQEKAGLDEKLKAKEKELEEEKASHVATKKDLLQEQLISQSLKEELTKVTKLKEALEEDLKEALVANKSAKSKMK